ncbi:DUF5041 domain-containing protein [Flavitalea sp. BT771]|uniref:DUF5041 domain-containing protein n=1 Tax=Flavitalea sp. BT771 TaxID=3063329 RepID=UPI0026E1870D|nr:DUF5041 domain-containing protein [Flavitalea sp. BT771]MDO6432698.1 DUF5041 domain-containing protein [Flavitalea sp. BT771]MDV6222026.1 DUF5041 domain-containing protein [Flavitalea sp. BT771]
MHKIVVVIGLFVCSNLNGQHYLKDARSPAQKEDPYNSYQSDFISKTDLLKALELAGVQVFKFPLASFAKEYKLSVTVDEYVDGKKGRSIDLYAIGKNTYTYFKDSSLDIHHGLFTDFIDQLTFLSRNENDSSIILALTTYAGSDRIRLAKRQTRKFQYYNWRRFSKTDWVLNRETPLLVCASSWYDPKNNVERFCGVVDLSRDEKETRKLLSASPHYYLISYKVSEK